jgi:hypothetical protein
MREKESIAFNGGHASDSIDELAKSQIAAALAMAFSYRRVSEKHLKIA